MSGIFWFWWEPVKRNERLYIEDIYLDIYICVSHRIHNGNFTNNLYLSVQTGCVLLGFIYTGHFYGRLNKLTDMTDLHGSKIPEILW